MLRCCRRDVEVPARVAAAVRRFAHLTSSGKYVFCGFHSSVNFTKKRVPELVLLRSFGPQWLGTVIMGDH